MLTRILMVWRGPGIKEQGRVDGPCVSLVDILPTICDIIGVETPFGVQGKSILPLLKDENIPEREYDIAYSESGFSGLYWTEQDRLDIVTEGASKNMITFDCLNTWTQCGQVRMVRKGDYKIQVDMMGNGYLYNLADDPMETVNLWNNPEYIEVKADMLTELTAAILKACDPLPVPHNRYRTKIHQKGYWYQDFVYKDPGVRKFPSLKDIFKR